MDNRSFLKSLIEQNGHGVKMWNAFFSYVQGAIAGGAEPDALLVEEQALEKEWREQLLQKFYERFVSRPDAYFKQWKTDDGFGYKFVESTVDIKLLREHVNGKVTLSVPALDENGQGKWICFDADSATGRLVRICSILVELGLHPHLERTGERNDGHCWVFFDRPLSAESLICFGNLICEYAGVETGDKIEVFPKSLKGSQVRLPLGIHRKPGAGNVRGWFDGAVQGLDAQLSWLADLKNDSAESICRLTDYLQSLQPKPQPIVKRDYSSSSPSSYSDPGFHKEFLPRPVDYYSSLNKFEVKPAGGTRAIACCPFHDDSKPSFSINLETGAYRCFSCSAAGGGIVDYQMSLHSQDFKDAARSLGAWVEREKVAS